MRLPTDRRSALISSTAPSYRSPAIVTLESSENTEAGSSEPMATRWVEAPLGTVTGTARRTSTRPSL